MDNKKMVEIPQEILNTQSEKGYFDYFLLLKDTYITDKATWETLEMLRDHYGLGARFTSINSFYNARSAYSRQLLKKD